MKKCVSIILTFAFAFICCLSIGLVDNIDNHAYAKDNGITEQKKYTTVDLEDDFSDDTILVVMNSKTSKNLDKKYKTQDFAEISCVDVQDLTELTVETIQRQSQNISNQSKKVFGASKEQISDDFMQVDVESFRRILSIKLQQPSKENVAKAIKELEKRADIISAEPDYHFSIFAHPNDPFKPDDYTYSKWPIYKINLPAAWDITTGSSSVVVGVLDTGIDGTHPDLVNRISTSKSKSFISYSTNALDDQVGHGTHVAGIIGAEGSNWKGISGVGWDIKIASLRVYELEDVCTPFWHWDHIWNISHKYGGTPFTKSSYLINAISYATQQGIPILNYSGGGRAGQPEAAIQTAIANYPGLYVCAAGNWGQSDGTSQNNDNTPIYPSNFNLPNLISVGATDINDNIWVGSNYGQTTVDIFAPGVDIYSTMPNNKYVYEKGTSMAAPYVAGVAALIKTKYPDLSASIIKQLIMGNADPIAALNGFCVSGGRLNAYNALKVTEVWNATDVYNIRNNPYGHYKLMTSIDLNSLGQWTPIPEFYGVLNGNWCILNGLTITGQTVTQDGAAYGLFGRNYGAVINMYMTGVNIYFDPDHSPLWCYVGAVAGVNYGTINDVSVAHSVDGNGIEVHRCYSAVGGIVGDNRGLVVNGLVYNIYMNGNGDIGGIAGNNIATGIIQSADVYLVTIRYYYVAVDRSVGGIVGYSYYNALIERAFVYDTTITIWGSDGNTNRAPYIGMVVGCLDSAKLWNVGAPNVTLINGDTSPILSGSQLANFGATPWWQWGGNWKGTCDVR